MKEVGMLKSLQVEMCYLFFWELVCLTTSVAQMFVLLNF